MAISFSSSPLSLYRPIVAGLAPATAQATPAALSGPAGDCFVRFGGKGQAGVFSAAERKQIARLMKRCRYGLAWYWLKEKRKLTLQQKEKGVEIGPYRTLKVMPLRDDCFGLAAKAGYLLQEDFKGKYNFYRVSGNITGTNWSNHVFLLAWPPEKDAEYLAQLKANPDTIPEGCYIIDPSYNLQGYPSESERLKCYYTFEEPILVTTGIRPGSKLVEYSRYIPLGFLKDLCPNRGDGKAIALVGFEKSPASDDPPRVMLRLDFEDYVTFPYWYEEIPPGTPLRQILELMETKLEEDPQAVSSRATPPVLSRLKSALARKSA